MSNRKQKPHDVSLCISNPHIYTIQISWCGTVTTNTDSRNILHGLGFDSEGGGGESLGFKLGTGCEGEMRCNKSYECLK